ncbi:MAG: ABC transporter permease [Armatimonadota bacterium]
MKKILGMILLLIGLMAIICVYQYSTTGSVVFFSPVNISNLAQRIGMLGIYTLGMGIVILSGGIDLSVGSVVGLVGVVIAMGYVNYGWSPWLMSLIVLPFCALLGFWHSFLIGRFKLQPFIVTLSSLLLLRGLARGISGGKGITLEHPSFAVIGNNSILGIPIPFLILIGLSLIVGFIMNYTVWGRYLYAIGRNEEAVRYSGIKVNKMRTLAYVMCAVLAGIAGIVEVSYTGDVQPANSGLMYEMWAVAAAVLGGCSMRGGEGTVIGIIVGSALIRLMDNGINLMGIPSDWQWAVIGIIIICGVIADAMHKQRQAKRLKA